MNGHDCGHGSFSNNNSLNNVFGYLTHTPLLVPYYTWKLSHNRHHRGHNHINNDYSHKWYPYNKKNKPLNIKFLQYSGLIPFFGWALYLMGFLDGGHWIPFGGKLWKNKFRMYNLINSIFSSIMVLSFLLIVIYLCNYNFIKFMTYYGCSWIMFSFWLVTTTYLQHHDDKLENTIVYGDKSWSHVIGALQTVDRSYGTIIDHLTHHITDGHLVHHLFFTKISHYNLKEATKYLYKYLDENKIPYKYRYTPNFFIKIFQLIYNHWNEAVYIE
jgi:omega-3 fatty acid desaturase (delta-15 desaturase)